MAYHLITDLCLSSNLNAICPFREGNGRTIRLLLSLLSNCYGWWLDWAAINAEENTRASTLAFHGNESALRKVASRSWQPLARRERVRIMSNQKYHDIEERLLQDKMIEASLTNGDGPWTVVYDSWREDNGDHGGRYIALSTPKRRDEILKNTCWDLDEGSGIPGFSKSVDTVEYYRIHEAPNLEPLIIVQEFHGVVPDVTLVSEEFILLMNLWKDPKSGNYFQIGDDGSKDLAIKIDEYKIEIRTPILKKYLAARQLDAVLFVDSVVSVPTTLFAKEFSDVEIEVRSNGRDKCISRSIGEIPHGDHKVFSRVLAKRILVSPPQETCGIWPWDKVDVEDYPEFIIGEDEIGKPIKFTCEPDQLANYFGANPDAPHYLTPVFFKPEVLQRYYDDSELYAVTAGHLSCAHKWGVDIDNHTPGFVMVFLGDIGRDIPSTHWAHWLAHNVPPTQRMSESHFRSSILGQWVNSESPEHLFKMAYNDLQRVWKEKKGWTLYRESDRQVISTLQRLRIPLNETETELRDQLLNLALVLVDPLNEKMLTVELPKVEGEKGVAKLKRYFKSRSYAYTDRDIDLLQKIQKMRSLISAHASGSRGRDLLEKELVNVSSQQYIAGLMSAATQMMHDLTELAKHADSADSPE